jgi:hypothetical protein
MTRVKDLAAATIALALVAGTGVCHGLWTARWQAARDFSPLVAQLEHVPLTIGEWDGQSERLDPQEITQAGVAGGWLRHYQNRANGERVTVMLIVGRPGPVSVHTPDVCYPASGYEPDGSAVRRAVTGRDGRHAEFWAADFQKDVTPVPARLRVHWAWGARGRWSAPFTPRLAFANQDVLYKLYVVRSLPLTDDRDRRDASIDFIETFISEAKIMQVY